MKTVFECKPTTRNTCLTGKPCESRGNTTKPRKLSPAHRVRNWMGNQPSTFRLKNILEFEGSVYFAPEL